MTTIQFIQFIDTLLVKDHLTEEDKQKLKEFRDSLSRGKTNEERIKIGIEFLKIFAHLLVDS